MRAVALHHLRQHLGVQANGLHGAQALVIDRHRARFIHGAAVALDQQRRHLHAAQQVAQRQATGTGTDHDHCGFESHVDHSRSGRRCAHHRLSSL